MGARADAATDRVSIASAPATGPLTICAWVKLASTTNATNTLVRFDAGGTTALILALRSLVPGFYSAASTTGLTGTAISTGTWYFLAATRDAANAAQLFQGTNPTSLSKVTGTVSSSGTPTSVNVFGRSTSDATDWLDGSEAHLRMWTAVLSDSEIAAEAASATPVRTSGLWSTWEFVAAALTDGSGNGRNLTAGSTALASDTDPVAGTISGTGSGSAPSATGSGSGTTLVSGSGAANAPSATGSGTGGAPVSGAGSGAVSVPTGSGTGSVVVGGDGAALAPVASGSGTGAVLISGSGAADSSMPQGVGAGGVLVSGSGAGAAPAAVGTGAGIVESSAPVTGSGAGSAPLPVGNGHGFVGDERVLDGALGAAETRWRLGVASGRWSLGAAVARKGD